MTKIDNKSYNWFDYAVVLCLLLAPILNIYGFGPINFSVIATFILIIINIFKSRKWENVPKLIVVYLLYWMLIKVVTASSLVSALPIGILFIFLYTILYFERVNIDLLLRCYEIIGIICIVFFWIQQFGYWATGTRISGVASFLPISLIDADDLSTYFRHILYGSRASSFFSEPAHFAQFLLPLLTVELLKFNRKSDIYSLLIIITLLFLQSGNGYLGIIIILIGYVLYLIINVNNKAVRIVFTILFIVIASPFLIPRITNSNISVNISERRTKELSGVVSNSSGFIRVFRGYYVYKNFSLMEKIFGQNDDAKIDSHISQSSVAGTFASGERYFNTFQSIIIRTGIVGLLLFAFLFFYIWKRTTFSGRVILTCFLALSFIASMFFTQVLILYLLIPSKMTVDDS